MRDEWYNIDSDRDRKVIDVRNYVTLAPSNVFGSNNDLKASGTMGAPGSCQWSSVIWCWYALNGYPTWDPREKNENELMWLVPERPFAQVDTNWLKRMTDMCDVLGMNTEEMTSNETNKSQQATSLVESMLNEKGVYLIWMSSHMVAVYTEFRGGDKYYYDNTIACVKSHSAECIKNWIEEVCKCNNEWGESHWTVVKCTLKGGKVTEENIISAVKKIPRRN